MLSDKTDEFETGPAPPAWLLNISVLARVRNETTARIHGEAPSVPPGVNSNMRRSPRHFLTIVGTAAFIVVAIIGLIGFVSAVCSIFHLILGTCGIKFILLVLLTFRFGMINN